MANDFSGEYNDLLMEDFNFLPSFRVQLLDNSLTNKKRIDQEKYDIDIFDQESIAKVAYPTINYEKLEQYISINLKAQYRKSNGENEYEETYYKTGFRLCTSQDFEKNGFKPNFKVEERYCPEDSGLLKEMLRVRNGYSDAKDRVSF